MLTLSDSNPKYVKPKPNGCKRYVYLSLNREKV